MFPLIFQLPVRLCSHNISSNKQCSKSYGYLPISPKSHVVLSKRHIPSNIPYQYQYTFPPSSSIRHLSFLIIFNKLGNLVLLLSPTLSGTTPPLNGLCSTVPGGVLFGVDSWISLISLSFLGVCGTSASADVDLLRAIVGALKPGVDFWRVMPRGFRRGVGARAAGFDAGAGAGALTGLAGSDTASSSSS